VRKRAGWRCALVQVLVRWRVLLHSTPTRPASRTFSFSFAFFLFYFLLLLRFLSFLFSPSPSLSFVFLFSLPLFSMGFDQLHASETFAIAQSPSTCMDLSFFPSLSFVVLPTGPHMSEVQPIHVPHRCRTARKPVAFDVDEHLSVCSVADLVPSFVGT
jgi:hypothetical protein